LSGYIDADLCATNGTFVSDTSGTFIPILSDYAYIHIHSILPPEEISPSRCTCNDEGFLLRGKRYSYTIVRNPVL